MQEVNGGGLKNSPKKSRKLLVFSKSFKKGRRQNQPLVERPVKIIRFKSINKELIQSIHYRLKLNGLERNCSL